MSDIIIKVENLGKKYTIGHQAQGGWNPNRQGYVALRDVVANGMKSFSKRLLGKGGNHRYTKEEFWALKDINFEIKQGEVIGIIGRNGAGKSTLLKILSRITEPTTGRVELRGRVASLLEVGTGFHPELTGRENIYLNGSILGMSRIEIRKKFDEIVDFAEVEKFLDTPVKRYSSGMYVRLAFAVAAHLEPEILVVDEVLAVGDAAFQKKCLGKMSNVAKQDGRTVLFVSHNTASIMALSKKSLLLEEGKSIRFDNTNDVISFYMDKFQENKNIFEIHYVNNPSLLMQLEHVKVLINSDSNSDFDIYDEISFEIDITTRSLIEKAYITINVLDYNDSLVYWTSDMNSRRFLEPCIGQTNMICKLPKGILVPGSYSANFAIVCLGRGTIDFTSNKRVFFKVIDTNSLLASYGVKYPGLTAVPSTWITI